MARVLIAEYSHIIGLGLSHLIQKFQEVENVRVVSNEEDCFKELQNMDPHILVVNTDFLKPQSMLKLMECKNKDAVVIHTFNSSLPIDAPDNQLSILDSKPSLHNKIEASLKKVQQIDVDQETEELSPREKAILKEVALGLTNKEIAEKTYISTHTVISHRKNITRKLGIKTVSGLTVYAILNNIIHMEDIS
ncbi:MAG: LuxR C-terminal-related transcriptional regulator [Carboxylicivirga sp.]|jgi:DNA-binding NarL/FixJ family response regulator|nr:LuxR C-terminal-related transcriptional regulator [Carboxylicivirga sp.]